MSPLLVSIQVGMPRVYGKDDSTDPMDQTWRSGIFKSSVTGPVHVGKTNIAGDGQADLKNHGGPDKAILCYSADHYAYWRERLPGIADFPHGAFGENLTIKNLSEKTTCIGDIWKIGDVELQVSQPRQPCWKLANRWRLADLPQWVIENGRSGWYVRVLREGTIQAGMAMTLLDRPHAKWTIAEANHLMFHRLDDIEGARELASIDFLASSWQRHFAARAAK